MYICLLGTHFERPRHAFGTGLLSSCFPFGNVWRFFGAPWAALGRTLGPLGLHWGTLRAPWNCFGDALGLFWASLEKKCLPGHPSQADGSQVPRLRTKTDPLEFACWSSRSRRNGPRTTVQDLPSTHAGDQDDVSFTNTLKLWEKGKTIHCHSPDSWKYGKEPM